MGKRGPQPTGQNTATIRLKKDTIKAIRRFSHETGKSQSEVVDRAMAALSLVDDLLYFMQDIDTDHEAVAINLFDR